MDGDEVSSDRKNVTKYLDFAKRNIRYSMFETARQNVELAKTKGATVEEINEIENELIVKTEQLLEQAQQNLSLGIPNLAKRYMNEAKMSGVLTEKILLFDQKIKFIEDAKNQIVLFQDYILKRDLKGAVKIKIQLQEVMSQLHSSTPYNNLLWKMSELEKEFDDLIEAQTSMNSALEYMNKGLFEEALKQLNSARQHGLPFELFSNIENLIRVKKYTSMAEVSVSKREYGRAEGYLSMAKNYNCPSEDIIKLQEMIDEARKTDKKSIDTIDSSSGPSYQHLTGNHTEDKKSVTATLSAKTPNLEFGSANNGIQKENMNIPMNKLKTDEQLKHDTSKEYPNECSYSENMAYSTLNDACCLETDSDDSFEKVKPENQRSSSSPINIKYGDSINNKYGRNNNVTSLESNVNQQALMRSFENFNVVSEEKNDIENRAPIPNKYGSNNIVNVTRFESNVNQQALLKPFENLNVLSEAESDTLHDDMKSHNIQKHQSTEDKNKGLQNSMSVKPPVSKKPDSAQLVLPKKNTEKVSSGKDVKTAKSTEPVPTNTNPKKSAIKSQSAINNVQVHEKRNANNACTRASALIKEKDVKTAQTQKDNSVPLTKKCELLIVKALKEGYIENAEKILQIAQKLYPEHDFAFLLLEKVEAKSKVTDSQTKEISSKPIQMNITETKPKVIERNQGNTGYYTFVHGIPETQDNDTLKKQGNYMKKTQDRERTRDKSVVHPKDDCKMSSNSYNNKENTVNNDIANREQADSCLKIAKTALDNNNVAKAERLATKADRMYPSEETKTLLAKISRIKSSVKDSEVKTEITKYSTINREDPMEAQKCLDVAFNAFSKDNIEKCKRFLKKANTFDKSIDIDVYMTDLQQKKVKKDLEIETEKARVKNKMQRSTNTDTGYYDKACNALKSMLGMGSQQETKNEYRSYTDCVQNKPSETKKSCENNSIRDSAATDCVQNKPLSPETKKSCENSSIGDSAASSQSGSNTHGDSAGKTGNGKEAENEGKSENELKAKELENKAVACAESGDYEQALLLLETAKGLHDTKSLQDITVQVQEAAETKKTAATSNQNLAKENEAKGSAESSNSQDIEMGTLQNNSETSTGTDSHVLNMKNHFETLNLSKTENNSHEYQHPSKVNHSSLELLKLGKGRGRGCRRKNKEENPTSSHPYDLRQRPCKGMPPKEEAKYLYDMGVEAYNHEEYKDAEKFVTRSDELDSNIRTRNLLSEIRGAKNRRGSWYCS